MLALCGMLALPAHAQSLKARAMASVVGVQPLDAQGLRFDNPVIGVPLTPRTRLIYEPRPVHPWSDNNGLTQPRPEQRVGFEFKSRSGARDLRNLLRLQLTSDSSLQFKPRSGGLAVSWRSEF
jgi:hypothetical protein